MKLNSGATMSANTRKTRQAAATAASGLCFKAPAMRPVTAPAPAVCETRKGASLTLSERIALTLTRKGAEAHT
jgi:hypothetical protein